MLLDNQDVLAWAHGQLLQPTAPSTPINPCPADPQARKPTRRVDRVARTPKLGSQLRFDLSKDALRGRRSKTDLAR